MTDTGATPAARSVRWPSHGSSIENRVPSTSIRARAETDLVECTQLYVREGGRAVGEQLFDAAIDVVRLLADRQELAANLEEG